jgi:phage baseplate assembly protein gpV
MEMKLKASATMDLMAGGQMSMKAPSIDATAGSVMVKGGSIMVQGASVTIQAGSILLQGAVVITGPLTVAGPIVGLVVTGTTTTTALANIV